jgi:hypothetical protein
MELASESGVVNNVPVNVGEDLVLRRLRMGAAGLENAGHMGRLFNETIRRGYGLLSPAATYKTADIERVTRDGVFLVEAELRVRSARVAALLEGCTRATFFGVTVGAGITAEIQRLMAEKRMTEAMLLDAFGSEAVESAVGAFYSMLKGFVSARGFELTRRFSPGYGDWPLNVQRAVTDFLNAERIGVSVNDASLLMPEKTVTAVAGWRRCDTVRGHA